MEAIDKRLEILISNKDIVFADKLNNFEKYKEADLLFQELLQKGFTKERGNNSFPIEELHLKKFTFNKIDDRRI